MGIAGTAKGFLTHSGTNCHPFFHIIKKILTFMAEMLPIRLMDIMAKNANHFSHSCQFLFSFMLYLVHNCTSHD
jgi:hypothetical protein